MEAEQQDQYDSRHSREGPGVEEGQDREAAGKTMVALCEQLKKPLCFRWGSRGLISIRVADLTHISTFGNRQLKPW